MFVRIIIYLKKIPLNFPCIHTPKYKRLKKINATVCYNKLKERRERKVKERKVVERAKKERVKE